MTDSPQAGGRAPDRAHATRWKHPELFAYGYVPVPVSLLLHSQHLLPGISLTPAEFVFVLNLMAHKWDASAPFPSYARIAERMGVTDKMVRRYAQQLEHKGLLRRERRIGDTNKFDLEPLFDLLLKVTVDQHEKLAAKTRKRRGDGEPSLKLKLRNQSSQVASS